jgi:hypothetical protein
VRACADKRKGRGVPYPGYFAKCTEAIDCKRVRGNSCFQVCSKCAERIGSKGVRRNTGGRVGDVSQIHAGYESRTSARLELGKHRRE